MAEHSAILPLSSAAFGIIIIIMLITINPARIIRNPGLIYVSRVKTLLRGRAETAQGKPGT